MNAEGPPLSPLQRVDEDAWPKTEQFRVRRGEAEYRLFVYRCAATNPPAKTIWLLDGGFLFRTAVDTLRLHAPLFQSAVIIGFAHASDEATDPRRLADFSALVQHDEQYGDASDTSFRRFFQELVPQVESALSLHPQERRLLGHSMAGHFAIALGLTAPDLFTRITAVSPSLWWNNRILMRHAVKIAARGDIALPAFHLIAGARERDVGDSEQLAFLRRLHSTMPEAFAGMSVSEALRDMAARLRRQNVIGNARVLARLLTRRGRQCAVDIYPDADHYSVALPGVAKAVAAAIR